MPQIKRRISLPQGYAECDSDLVLVGDRLIPRRIDVHFPSAPDLPSLDMTFEVRRGVPVVTSVRVDAKEQGREVRSSDLRAAAPEKWLEVVVAAMSLRPIEGRPGVAEWVPVDSGAAQEAAVQHVQRSRKGTRRQITEEVLREVAQLYRAHVDDRPVVAVAKHFVVEQRSAARYVQMSRRAGYLPPTSPGKRKA